MRLVSGALAALDAVTQALNVLGSALIVGLMLLIGADVIGQNLFDAPIPGVTEIVSLSIVAIVFLQIGAAARAGRLTRSEAVLTAIRRRAPRVADALEILFDLMAIGIVAVILWQTWPLLVRAWERGTFVGAIGDFTAPTWPIRATIVVGGTILILQFAARILRRLAGQ